MIKPAQFLTDRIRVGFAVLVFVVCAIGGVLAVALGVNPETIQSIALAGIIPIAPCLRGHSRNPKNAKRNQRGGAFVFILCLLLFGVLGLALFGILGMLVALIVVTVIYMSSMSSEEKEKQQKRLISGQLVKCGGCEKPISPLAEKCPNCGHPQDPATLAAAKDQEAKKLAEADEKKKKQESADKARKEYEDANPHIFCPKCKKEIGEKRQCNTCGWWSCPKCREEIRFLGKRCSHCGWTKS